MSLLIRAVALLTLGLVLLGCGAPGERGQEDYILFEAVPPAGGPSFKVKVYPDKTVAAGFGETGDRRPYAEPEKPGRIWEAVDQVLLDVHPGRYFHGDGSSWEYRVSVVLGVHQDIYRLAGDPLAMMAPACLLDLMHSLSGLFKW